MEFVNGCMIEPVINMLSQHLAVSGYTLTILLSNMSVWRMRSSINSRERLKGCTPHMAHFLCTIVPWFVTLSRANYD